METLVSPAGLAEVDDVAELHGTVLRDSFLASTGPRMLRLVYRRLVLEPTTFVLVARLQSAGDVVGLVAGAESTPTFYRAFLVYDLVPATLAAAPLVRTSGRRLVETLQYGSRPARVRDITDHPGSTPSSPLPRAELLSLGVRPEARRHGVGATLVAAFQLELQRRGVSGARVVVAADNAGAIRRYTQAGFANYGEVEIHRGRTSKVLVWS